MMTGPEASGAEVGWLAMTSLGSGPMARPAATRWSGVRVMEVLSQQL